jgi:hypothetical protein
MKLCKLCPNPAASRSKYCYPCRRKLLKSTGLCLSCKQIQVTPPEVNCPSCRQKIADYMRLYRDKPEVRRKKSLEHKKRKYNITELQFKILLDKQNNVCAICNTLGYRRSKVDPVLGLCIDHDHKTNKIRGLLCYRCNAALGNLNDDISLLEKAISYLKENN